MSSVSEKPITTEQPLPQKKGRWLLMSLAAAGLIVAVGAVALTRMQQVQKPAVAPTPAVKTNPVPDFVSATGRLEPQGEIIKLFGASTDASSGSAAQRQSGMGQARVEKILVKEGESVRVGQAVATLDTLNTRQAALEEAKAKVQQARANLDKVKAGVQPQGGDIPVQRAVVARQEAELRTQREAQLATIARLEAQLKGETTAQQASLDRINAQIVGQRKSQQATVARVQAEQRNAQADVRRYESLYKEGVISSQELDRRRLSAETSSQQLNESQATQTQTLVTLEQQLNEAKANRDKTLEGLRQQIVEARANLNRIEATGEKQIEEARARLVETTGVKPADIEVAQAEVTNAIAGLKRAQADLELSYVRAPINGEILKIHAKPGETIGQNGIAEIGQTSQMMAIAEVPEDSISRVRPGQKAIITSDNQAFNGKIQGTVTEIGRKIGRQDVLQTDPAADIDTRVVEVKINLTPQDSAKVAGLTNAKVVVRIDI